MAEINGIDLAHMPNGAHYLFALDVLNKAKANAKIAERAAAAVGVLEKKVAAEDEALQLSRKSLKTDEIKSLDGTRDSMYSYYRKGVKAFLGAPLDDVVEAAKELDQHMTDYAINPQMQLDKETGMMLNFTADLTGKYAEQVAKLGLTMYVTAMKEANDKLHELTTERTDERALQVAGALKSARSETDEAYRALVKLVNALYIVEYDAAYDEFINYVNAEIKHYKEEVLSSSSSKKKAASVKSAATSSEGGETK